MDKYTVDLDKVLNDFEYSELTEQSNGLVPNSGSYSGSVYGYSSAGSAPNQLPHKKPGYQFDSSLPFETQPYPKTPNSSSKHSINNVFHSLNEYLNSDIKTEVGQPISSISQIPEIEADIPELVRKPSGDRGEFSSIRNIFKGISSAENSLAYNNSTLEASSVSTPEFSHSEDFSVSNFPILKPADVADSRQEYVEGIVSNGVKTFNNNVDFRPNLNKFTVIKVENVDNSIKAPQSSGIVNFEAEKKEEAAVVKDLGQEKLINREKVVVDLNQKLLLGPEDLTTQKELSGQKKLLTLQLSQEEEISQEKVVVDPYQKVLLNPQDLTAQKEVPDQKQALEQQVGQKKTANREKVALEQLQEEQNELLEKKNLSAFEEILPEEDAKVSREATEKNKMSSVLEETSTYEIKSVQEEALGLKEAQSQKTESCSKNLSLKDASVYKMAPQEDTSDFREALIEKNTFCNKTLPKEETLAKLNKEETSNIKEAPQKETSYSEILPQKDISTYKMLLVQEEASGFGDSLTEKETSFLQEDSSAYKMPGEENPSGYKVALTENQTTLPQENTSSFKETLSEKETPWSKILQEEASVHKKPPQTEFSSSEDQLTKKEDASGLKMFLGEPEPSVKMEAKILTVNEDKIEVMIQPVGFSELDLSDTELENELAQLEADYKQEIDNNFFVNTNEDSYSPEDPKKDLKSELEEVASSVPRLIQESEKVSFTTLKQTEEPKKEKDEIKPSQETEKSTSEKKEDSVEIVIKEEGQNGGKDPDHERMKDENAVVKENTPNEEDLRENLKEMDEGKSGKSAQIEKSAESHVKAAEESQNASVEEVTTERRNSTLMRPNSLDLNSESTSENLTINLIGDPGSTPYNNVYVENSLQPEKNTQTSDFLEAENDASNNSLSPTLSDASTYDNSDSPNTSDSCNDTSLDEFSNDNNAGNLEKAPEKDVKNNRTVTKTENESNVAEGRQENLAQDSSTGNQNSNPASWLGKTAPFWTPDSDTLSCLHCNLKFTVIKRRHHCRACGLVLCSKCCNMKCKLQYMDNVEARVCIKCYDILTKDSTTGSSGSDNSPEGRANGPPGGRGASQTGRLNPNNPMEYCSTVPPHQQVAAAPNQPPTVMVPVGVLKRKGSGKSRSAKSVMFCDGIRPGCDLTELDHDFNYKEPREDSSTSSKKQSHTSASSTMRSNRNLPKIDTKTSSYIPSEENGLPPIVNVLKSDIFYADCSNNNSVVEMLKNETITFAIQRNFHIQVGIINMDCCINKQAWCFSTEGMIAVGQDEIVILLEFIDNEKYVPKDIFLHLNNIYNDAVKGTSITEMGISIHPTSNFLESKNHAGFLYIKSTFQCIQNVILPKEPYLIGVLIHRWETPWAKIFPLRLFLRLGAEYRYYPSPIISTRHRESVYVEIGHTVINLLADFRNFSYTIPAVRGLTIHMEDKNTTVSIPLNRYDQVMKALNNSSDHILAFAANFSPKADSHLVCIQDTHGNNENAYTTHAINIHNKPRKVTGASFIVLNGALKSSSGLTAKSSIIEDGLMIQILPEQMLKLRTSLRNMKDFRINCGCVNAQSDESVSILWTENDSNFNVGVLSPIDNMPLNGIPSIRVHNGKDYVCNSGSKMIRWTEVFIIQSGEESTRTQDPIDVSKTSENISKATSQALVKYLDLLATNSCTKIGIRTTLHIENVSYLAGSNGTKLPPIYMKSLDNELIPVLHRITANFGDQASVVLELVFHILNV